MYVVPIGGMCVRQKCAIGGSGSTYIYGHIDRHFKEGMNVDEIKQFVVDCKFIISYPRLKLSVDTSCKYDKTA